MADPGQDVLPAVPLLAGVPASTRRAVHARGIYLDVAAGEEIIRRWDSDRFFYIVLAGRYDIFIDGRTSVPSAPVSTSASSPRATGEAATVTPVLPPSAAPKPAGPCSQRATISSGWSTPNRRSRPGSPPPRPSVSRIASAPPGEAATNRARRGQGPPGLGGQPRRSRRLRHPPGPGRIAASCHPAMPDRGAQPD